MGNATGNFGEATTTDEVLEGIDLAGKRYLVTGASAGLGIETTRALAAHGAKVSMAVRDLDKGAGARDQVLATVPDADLELRELDLASLDSVRQFGKAWLADHDTLDCFIGNAGIMACPQGETVDGWELQFGTNHLGHFLLFNLIAPTLVAAGDARVVLLSSSGHRFSDVDLDDPNFERTPYDPWISYGRAKTANSLMAVGVDDRFKAQGVRANALHPGAIHTELARHLTQDSMMQLIDRVKQAEDQRGGRQLFKKVDAGAATTVYAACHPDMQGVGAQFLEDCHIAEPTSDPVVMSGVRTYALDHDTADRLWAKSLEWVGLAAN